MNSTSESILRTEHLSKNFGALSAVDDVSFEIKRGEIRAIIGPNGAGKSTTMDLIINRTPPTSGHVYLKGQEITHKKPFKIANMGLCKCFQISRLFSNLSCYQNVQIALIQKHRKTYSFFPQKPEYLYDEAIELLDSVGIKEHANEKATFLSYGDQRRLEIAITLALEPEVLFLDEPTAGVARAEGYALMSMVRDLAVKKNMTLLFIEHDMDIVFNYADQISVMAHGKLIATDVPEKIRENEFVKQAYLGGEADA